MADWRKYEARRDLDKRTASKRRAWLKQYGLTPERYELRLKLVDYRCEICGCEPTGAKGPNQVLHIDHDHKTGKFRGILCPRCNHMIGHAKDDPQVLRRAAQYLEML